uniref:AT hook containing transcription factor 1 n=1 Tax=Gadus morhua TaxID=8049 RepID=A0A8C5CTT9_GADMO
NYNTEIIILFFSWGPKSLSDPHATPSPSPCAGRGGVAWLSCGPQLEVVDAATGVRLSAYCFSGEGDHPPNILAARDFSWLKRSGLLVGLEEVEGSMLCLYDLGLSRVVKAVVIPGRITSIEPLVSYGGASTTTQHLHQSLRWFFGIAAVVTDLGHVLLVDLCLDDLSCSQSELEASDLEVVTKSPAEIPRLREASSRQGRHLCLQLSGPSGTKATALQYISRTNQVAVGFADGYLQNDICWFMGSSLYHSQLEAGQVPVYAFTFQEPENDPRNCCYLWAVQSAQDEGDVVSLHLLQLAFSERKCMASGKILYEGLEYCEERYSQDVSGTAFPLRAQATNTRLLSCQTIEKFRPHPDRDDSMNEAASPDTSVSIFSWQVKAYGQGKPTTCIGVFDINRWYHAQMPDSLRYTGETLHSCPYFAVWSLDPVVEMVSPRPLLDVVVHDRSLSRGLPCTWPPPEQFFNPTTYNFDATCLLNSGVVHLTCSGHQKETLSFLKKAVPCSSDFICSSYTRCLMSGLLSSRLADRHLAAPSQEEQLDAILWTAVETSSLGLITGCIKQWTAEEQPGSALNLRFILEWAWNKVVSTKEELDGICAPLFDSSSNFTDPQTLQLLQHSQRLLGNLSAIFHCLLSEAQELTQRGLVGLMNKNLVSSLISQYAQVVLWFCRTGLLPEGSDEDALQISRPFYTHGVISSYYTIRREDLTRLAKGKWCADCLMIDGLVSQCGERLVNLWKRDDGGTGQYPPPTLHALLDIYLLEDMDEAAKHAIVIYLLLDVMYSFPNKGGASVESFPTAFALPIGLVKLVQGLWLLDHHDHQSSVELLLHPTTSQCHFPWQHERVLQALMCQGQHAVALRYLHVTKPPLSSSAQAKLCLSVLLHNRCLVEALSMLRQHSTRLSMEQLLAFLYESCQELGLIKELLRLPLSPTEQECLERFLQGMGGLQNRELLMVHYLQQANYIPALQLNQGLKTNLMNERDPKVKERSNSRNALLDQYWKVLPRVQRRMAMERAKPYSHPATSHREVNRPQPLSSMAKRSANDKVMSRAGFISNVLTKIEEVWLGKGATPTSSPLRSPRASESLSASPKPCSRTLSDPFLGTPIAVTARRKSRLVDLVVRPSSQTPGSLLSPVRAPGSQGVPPRSIARAPELSLLHTPQVVKRARALVASGSVFSAFTPHSILRSSLRPTPVATPSASPGRSVTPPLRGAKESRIAFIERTSSPEMRKGPAPWSNGVRASPGRGAGETTPRVTFMPPAGGVPSPQLRGSDSDASSLEELPESRGVLSLSLPPGALPGRLSLGLETSLTSVLSSDSTLEFHDAPLGEDREEEDVLVVSIKTPQDGETEKSVASTDDEEEEEEEEEDILVVSLKTPQDGETEKSVASTDEEEEKVEEMVADGEVVMVRLGGLDGADAVDAGTLTELKPSATLLVPLELVEGHEHSLVDGAQVGLTVLGKESEADSPTSGAHSGFSLMLEVEDMDSDADTLPLESHQNALELAVQGITDQLTAPPEDLLQDMSESQGPLHLLMEEDSVVEAEASQVEEAETPEVVEAEAPEVEAEAPEVEEADAPEVVEAEAPEVVEAEAPEVVEAETPEVVEAEAPEVVEAEAPEMLEAEAPEVVEAEAPEMVEAEAPEVVEAEAAEVVEAEAAEVVEAEAAEVVEAEAAEVVEAEAPEVVEAEAPEVVEAEAPEVVEAEAPEVVEAEAPEVVEAEAPEVVEAEAPEVVEAEAPEVVEAEAPEVVEAEAPEVMEAEAPEVVEAEAPLVEAADPVLQAADPVEVTEPVLEAEVPVLEAEDSEEEAADLGLEAEDLEEEAEDSEEEAADLGLEAEDSEEEAADLGLEAEDPVAEEDIQDSMERDCLMEPEEQSPQPDLSASFSPHYMASHNVYEEGAEEEVSQLFTTELGSEEDPESDTVSLAFTNRKVEAGRFTALEAMMEDTTHAPSEDTLADDGMVKDLEETIPEGSLPEQTDGDVEVPPVFQNTETVATLEEEREQVDPEENTVEGAEEFHKLQEESRRRSRKRGSEDQGGKDGHVRQVFSSEDPADPEPSSEEPAVKKAPATPTRRATRGRKTVSWTAPPPEVVQEEEEEDDVSMTSLRSGTRVRRQSAISQHPANTPRRSARKTPTRPPIEKEVEVVEEEGVAREELVNNDLIAPKATPAKRRTPQKASPSRVGRKSRGRALEEVEEVEEAPEETVNNVHHEDESRAKGPPPAKRRTRQGATPTRASRRKSSVGEAEPPEEEPQEAEPPAEEQGATSFTRISRIRYSEARTVLLEVEEEEEEEAVKKAAASSSPSRGTRASSRASLSAPPQVSPRPRRRPIRPPLVCRSLSREVCAVVLTADRLLSNPDPRPQVKPVSQARARGRSSAAKPLEADAQPGEAPPTPGSRRLTRSRLWEQAEEDLPFLDPPLEVDSQTPVADALIKRLQDEEEQEGGWSLGPLSSIHSCLVFIMVGAGSQDTGAQADYSFGAVLLRILLHAVGSVCHAYHIYLDRRNADQIEMLNYLNC